MQRYEINTASQCAAIAAHYHSVHTLQSETGRSRSWAYAVMRQLPQTMVIDMRSGKQQRMVRRDDVRRYLRTLRRPGNPNWG